MKYRIETTKNLIADNGNKFAVGNDIAFSLFNNVTDKCDRYIGTIKHISQDAITIFEVEINKKPCPSNVMMIIWLSDIEKGSCKHVTC